MRTATGSTAPTYAPLPLTTPQHSAATSVTSCSHSHLHMPVGLPPLHTGATSNGHSHLAGFPPLTPPPLNNCNSAGSLGGATPTPTHPATHHHRGHSPTASGGNWGHTGSYSPQPAVSYAAAASGGGGALAFTAPSSPAEGASIARSNSDASGSWSGAFALSGPAGGNGGGGSSGSGAAARGGAAPPAGPSAPPGALARHSRRSSGAASSPALGQPQYPQQHHHAPLPHMPLPLVPPVPAPIPWTTSLFKLFTSDTSRGRFLPLWWYLDAHAPGGVYGPIAAEHMIMGFLQVRAQRRCACACGVQPAACCGGARWCIVPSCSYPHPPALTPCPPAPACPPHRRAR